MGQHRAPETPEVPITEPTVIQAPVVVIADPLPPVPPRRQPAKQGAGAWSKTITAATFAVFSLLSTVGQDPSGIAWAQVLTQASSVVLVAIADNRPPGAKYAKFLVAGVSAALTVFVPVLVAGGWAAAITQATITNACLAIVAAISVWWVPNTNADGVNVLKAPPNDGNG